MYRLFFELFSVLFILLYYFLVIFRSLITIPFFQQWITNFLSNKIVIPPHSALLFL